MAQMNQGSWRAWWRLMTPLRGLIAIIVFHTLFSLSYIIFFTVSFALGKRIVVLHMSIMWSLMVATLIGLALVVRCQGVRQKRVTRWGLSFCLATGAAAITFLYAANYIGHTLWGNNISYEIVAQYASWHGLFQKPLRLLPIPIYLAVVGGLTLVFCIYWKLSGALLNSLEHLCLADGVRSPLCSRHRVFTVAAGVAVSLFFLGGLGVLSLHVTPYHRTRILLREPIISFFANAGALNAFVRYDKQQQLEIEEQRIRAHYPPGQSFEKRNVVLITVDALRADHMQIYGYERPTTPFLSRLFEAGYLRKVKIATSSCIDTNCGILSTLSSKTVKYQVPRSFKLHDVLYDQGYKVYFLLSGTFSRPSKRTRSSLHSYCVAPEPSK